MTAGPPLVPARPEMPLLVVVTALLRRSRAVFRFPVVVSASTDVGSFDGAALQDLDLLGVLSPTLEDAIAREGGFGDAWETWPPCDLLPWGKLVPKRFSKAARPAAIPPRVVDPATARRLVRIGPPEDPTHAYGCPGWRPRRISTLLVGSDAFDLALRGEMLWEIASLAGPARADVLLVPTLGREIVFVTAGAGALEPEGFARLLVEPDPPPPGIVHADDARAALERYAREAKPLAVPPISADEVRRRERERRDEA